MWRDEQAADSVYARRLTRKRAAVPNRALFKITAALDNLIRITALDTQRAIA